MRKFFGLAIIVGAFLFMTPFASAANNDASIPNITAGSDSNTIGGTANILMTMEVTTAIPAGSKINITLDGNGLTETNPLTAGATITGLNGTVSMPTDSSIEIVLSDELAVNTHNFSVDGITNPSVPSVYYVLVSTDASNELDVPGYEITTNYATTSAKQIVGEEHMVASGEVTATGAAVDSGWVEMYGQDRTPFAGSVIREGEYYIFKDADDNSWVSGMYNVVAYPGRGYEDFLSNDQMINYEAGSATAHNIALNAPTKVINGHVEDTNGAPIQAVVTASGLDGYSKSYEVNSDIDGDFTLTVDPDNAPYTFSLDNCIGDADTTECGGWSYQGQAPQIGFDLENGEAETKDITIIVTPATASATGTVSYEGTPVEGYIDFYSVTNIYRGWMNESGEFTVYLEPGQYNIDLLPMAEEPGSDVVFYQIPVDTVFDISKGANDLGALEAIFEQSNVIANVTDTNEDPLTRMRAHVWRASGGEFRSIDIMPDSDGSGGSEAQAGAYYIKAFDPNGDYYPDKDTVEVTLADGEDAEVDFVMTKITSRIDVSVLYPDGTQAGNLSSYVQCYDDAQQKGYGEDAEFGAASLKAPAGTYICTGSAPAESGYSLTASDPVVVDEGETEILTMTLVAHDATISGTLADQSGTAITNAADEDEDTYGDSDEDDLFQVQLQGENNLVVEADIEDDGTWSASVPAGDYLVSATGPNLLDLSGVDISTTATATASQTTADVEVAVYKSDTTIDATVYEPDGSTVLPYAWVECTYVPEEKEDIDGGRVIHSGAYADALGAVSVPVIGQDGDVELSYDCSTGTNDNDSYIAPASQASVEPGTDVTFIYFEPDSTIEVSYETPEDVTATDAHCVAWAEDSTAKVGAVDTDMDGTVSLSVSSEVSEDWNVSCDTKDTDSSYVAAETEQVAVSAEATATATIETEANSFDVETAASETFDANTARTFVLGDTQVNVPANSITTDGSVTMTFTPEATDIMKDDANMNFGIPWSIEAYDADGRPINELKSDISMTFSYEDDDLDALGVAETDLLPEFFDEAAGSWTPVDGAAVDVENNQVTLAVDHLTQFNLLYNANTIASDEQSDDVIGDDMDEIGQVENVRIPKKKRGAKSLTVKWDEAAGAETYRVQLKKKNGALVKTFKGITAHKKKIPAKRLLTNQAYTIKVRAVSATDELGDWSEPVNARTKPGKVKNVKYNSGTQMLRWKKVRGKGITYQVKVMNLKGKKLRLLKTTKKKKSLSSLADDKRYKVRVRAKYNKNTLGAWSKVKRIRQ